MMLDPTKPLVKKRKMWPARTAEAVPPMEAGDRGPMQSPEAEGQAKEERLDSAAGIDGYRKVLGCRTRRE